MFVPDKCPRCGCTVLESREKPRGTVHVLHDLKTGEVDFSIMYDEISSRGKWLYCNNCLKRICTIDEFYERYGIRT